MTKIKDKTLPILTHLLGIFTYIFGALFIYFLTKDKYAKKHAINAINWQISLGIYNIIILTTSTFSEIIEFIFRDLVIIFPFELLLSVLTILNIMFCIIATVKANEEKLWKYPLTLELLKK